MLLGMLGRFWRRWMRVMMMTPTGDLYLDTPDARRHCRPPRIGNRQGIELIDQVGDKFAERARRPRIDTQAAGVQSLFLGVSDLHQFRLVTLDLAQVPDRDLPGDACPQRLAVKF
jgi:hypothetical protein